MDIYELIKKRRTIRRFTQKKIDRDLLIKFIEHASLAPSGMNIQPWEFIIIDEDEICDKIFPNTAWAGYLEKEGPPPANEKPTAYIICLLNKNLKSPTLTHDISAAIENILLCATYEGIGSCWIGSINRERIREILNIPENYEIDSIIALGYPNQCSYIEKMKDSIKYWKD